MDTHRNAQWRITSDLLKTIKFEQMKKLKQIGKIFGYIILGIFLLGGIVLGGYYIKWNAVSNGNMERLGNPALELTADTFRYRDLNKNGKLDIYEDKRQTVEDRIDNLLSQMALDEKAGLMFINMIAMNPDGALSETPSFKDPITFAFEANSTYVAAKKMNHFNIIQSPDDPQVLIRWNNNIQKLAERTRLGIPVTIASDPRHGVRDNPGAGIESNLFSEWPSPLGLAATRDFNLVREFAKIANQEYRAVGIRLALHPTADLATEPRWARISDTFGEDAFLSAQMTAAYIEGFQGDSLNHESVACMTKHFSGGGPQKDGWDAHFENGKQQVYPGNNFKCHLIPFESAIKAKTAQIMPYYGIPVGQTSEEVAFGFNKEIITGLLRNEYDYDGVVCTDWGIISDMFVKPASDWGMENATPKEKIAKVLNAGCDMFGGESLPELVVELVEEGKIPEKRLDVSVRRILKDKFNLGLFDDPYLDEGNAQLLRQKSFIDKGKEAQRSSLTLLKNDSGILPLNTKSKVYLQGFSDDFEYFDIERVDNPEDADCIVLKLNTPFEPGDGAILERFFKQGRLDFPKEEKDDLLKLIALKPTITVLTIDRPPVVPEINKASQAVIADFFSSEEIIMDLILGKFNPNGKLPIEIPSSMKAVENQLEDVPYDSENPLYPFGYGLSY